MAAIELVVFDMAGTIIDEKNVVYKTMHKVLVDNGYPVTLDHVLVHGAGKVRQASRQTCMQPNINHVRVFIYM